MAVYDLKLAAKRLVCEDVMELDFTLADGKKFSFTPGQYLNVHARLGVGGGHTGRSYTIASSPDDSLVRFAIRKRGEFSSFLHGLAIGQEVIVDGPHGTLCPSVGRVPQVCLAAGIGICPFVSWMRSGSASKAPMRVLVTNSTEARSPYVADVLKLASEEAGISVTSFLTQQTSGARYASTYRRINASDVKQALEHAPEAVVSICGPISFTRDMRNAALTLGVGEERILTEAFF